METKNMIYIVSEYASQGEIFGECAACGGVAAMGDVLYASVCEIGAPTAVTMKSSVI
jgi:hypothetical protein